MPPFLKHGYCKYEDCGLDLGMVYPNTKYCPTHRVQKRKQEAQAYHREHYKSKFHRDRVRGNIFKNPKPIPQGLKEGEPCPGNGNGWCGAIIHRERAIDEQGCSTPFFDYFCGTHRFPDPREQKER